VLALYIVKSDTPDQIQVDEIVSLPVLALSCEKKGLLVFEYIDLPQRNRWIAEFSVLCRDVLKLVLVMPTEKTET